MEVRIKPYHKNIYAIGGILIKNPSATVWLKGIQDLKLTLDEVSVFVIPDMKPKSIWGCFVLFQKSVDIHKIGKYEACQKISNQLYIPEKAILHPPVTLTEIKSLFHSGINLIHPEFGFVELTEVLDLETMLTEPVMKSYYIIKPEQTIFIPKQIKQFQIKPVTPEETLKHLEEQVFPKKEKMKDDSLNFLEKGKLIFYKLLFRKSSKNGINGVVATEKTGLWSKIESLIHSSLGKEPKWIEKMQRDFEDLERRNQKELDKLLELLKNNPEEALKYAIPIDDMGSTRGGTNTQFNLSKMWSDFSLFNTSGSDGRSGTINLGDSTYLLRQQYLQTAQELIKQRQFHKAAFIYMKLLKDFHSAAQTLENGDLYQDAATVYLKHCNNKQKAAECYEKGKMTNEAITLYKELNQNEKVGDLYVSINKKKDADVYYEKVVDTYKSNNQYVKASLIYKNKIQNSTQGQSLLMEGWRKGKDASSCLSLYLSNIEDMKILKAEISNIYINDLPPYNCEAFVRVLQNEYKKKNELSDSIKEMAYEVIASQLHNNPEIISEIKIFNKSDKELTKDVLRFKLKNKK